MKRYLLLGGSGFIGSRLAVSLSLKNEVVVVGHRPEPNIVLPNSQYRQLDYTRCEDFTDYIKDVDVIVHLVSTIVPSETTDDITMEIERNVTPTIALLRDASRLNKKVLFISSGGAVYGENKKKNKENGPTNPICNYGIIKLMIEKYFVLFHDYYGLDYRIVRPSNPYSELVFHNKKQGIIPVVIENILNDLPMTIYGNRQVRDYIYIDDLVDGINAVLEYSGDRRIFNIGTGVGSSIGEVIGMIEKKLCKKLQVDWRPMRKCDVMNNVLDVSLIEQETGWAPKVSLPNGINRVVNNRLREM